MIRRPPRSTLFPTRRSSDLKVTTTPVTVSAVSTANPNSSGSATVTIFPPNQNPQRSEEHTSELQSQSNLVCRLLLEKKKNTPYVIRVIATSQPHLTLQ